MIHSPNVMPDEVAMGYWGRVLRLNAVPNGINAELAFTAAVCRKKSSIDCRSADGIDAISAVAQTPLPSFIRAHTLIPLDGAVMAVMNGDWCGNSYSSRQLRRTPMSHLACPKVLCAMCASEDLDFWGFSYWRRSHQVPAIVLCQKHGCPLRRASTSRTSRSMPHEALRDAQPFSDELVDDAARTPVLQRYADICSELLQRSRPLSTLQVAPKLAVRAKALGLTVGQNVPGLRLRDLAAERISEPWQKAFDKALSVGMSAKDHALLDRTAWRLLAPPQGWVYALAIAMLFDESDAAILKLSEAPPSVRSMETSIDREAGNLPHAVPPRIEAGNEHRCAQLRGAIDEALRGAPINAAATAIHWYLLPFESTLLRCLVDAEDESAAISRRPAVGSYS